MYPVSKPKTQINAKALKWKIISCGFNNFTIWRTLCLLICNFYEEPLIINTLVNKHYAYREKFENVSFIPECRQLIYFDVLTLLKNFVSFIAKIPLVVFSPFQQRKINLHLQVFCWLLKQSQ